MMRTETRAALSPTRRIGLFCVASVFSMLLALAAPALADHHSDSEGSPDASADPSAPAAPPPGTLSSEGIVPHSAAVAGAGGDVDSKPPMEEIGHVPGANEGVYGDPPNSGSGDPEQRGWAYDTDYFFALTRGLEPDTDLSAVGIRWVRPLTVTMDVVTLPTAALAGLSGRAPAEEPVDEHAEEADASVDGASEAAADTPAADAEPSTGEPSPDADTLPADAPASDDGAV